MLLTQQGIVDSFEAVHPKDIQDGRVKVSSDDVLANVPYVPGCGFWFDHHPTESERIGPETEFEGRAALAPSTAQVIWDHFGGDDAFPQHLGPLVDAVNLFDMAELTSSDILRPAGWVLLAFILDPRTGLRRFTDYAVTDGEFCHGLIEACLTESIEKIIERPEVQERVQRYFEQQELHIAMLLDGVRTCGNVIVTDLRDTDPIYAGNRFLVFALFEDQNVEIRVMHGKRGENTVFTCGHSILNRTCRADVGKVMFEYGGGGHEHVGACQIENERADRVFNELIDRFQDAGR